MDSTPPSLRSASRLALPVPDLDLCSEPEEILHLSVEIGATAVSVAENPSSFTSIDIVEAGEETRDTIMEDLPSEFSKSEINSESQKSSKEHPFGSEEPSTDSTSETPNKSVDTVKMSDEEEEDEEEAPLIPTIESKKAISMDVVDENGGYHLCYCESCRAYTNRRLATPGMA